jgi:deoxyribodipyrimidine photo-lyase
MTSIVWFRQDLRRRDNPALTAAATRGPVVPVFILDDITPGLWRWGGASRWWLHHSLAALQRDLGGLVLYRGDPHTRLPDIAKAHGASAVYWNRCYEPFAVARDAQLKETLHTHGIAAESFNGGLLREPWEIATGSGEPFKVYTPYWRACLRKPVAAPLPAPTLKLDTSAAGGDPLEEWKLLPKHPNWANGWDTLWEPGEAGATKRLDGFVTEGLAQYRNLRDRPDRSNVSRLSPHLHWGEISPRQIWARMSLEAQTMSLRDDIDKFLSELGWREFSHHLLYHCPSLPERNWRKAFDAYPWRSSAADLKAWQRGQTGYPLVDAGMRELWQTGWMHNRVRMIAASFLIKHLRIDWREGEAWFWDTLVDADLANNAASWQWVAGSGADASPYFRIFNPIIQGKKFDPDGSYIRRWCPELARLPNAHIHAPFDAPAAVLADAGVTLGTTYPHPIVDHDDARKQALAGYQTVQAAMRG